MVGFWKESGGGLLDLPHFQELQRSVWVMDDGVGGTLPGPSVTTCLLTILRG